MFMVLHQQPKIGEYFRNNVWWWRPLWEYVITVAPEVISEELAEQGHYNDGAGLDADQAKRLGEILFTELWEGKTLKYQEEYNYALSILEKSDCSLCSATRYSHRYNRCRNGSSYQGTFP